ncbi:MAG: hypothetical protein M3Y87_34890 [Myxococcota bacterium]|nr:hypothetical protein [Myxococcota bacterium]
MEWGTVQQVAGAEGADHYESELKRRVPEVPSAYVPSGRMGATALPWLALGAALGVPAGAAATGIAGAITLLLFTVMGAVIALVAACGWVVCMTVVIELGIALIGSAITFAVAGLVPGWIVAAMGKRGLNRSPWAAALFAVPSAVLALAIALAVPYVATAFVPVPLDPDELSVAGALHTFFGTSWVHLVVILIGVVITIAAAALFAHSEVGAQKFCERCQRYMDRVPLPGVSFDRALWMFERLRAGAAREVPPHLAGVTGELDVEPELHRCAGCAGGFFEARAHARTEWVTSKGDKDDRHSDWICFSTATRPEDSDALATCRVERES